MTAPDPHRRARRWAALALAAGAGLAIFVIGRVGAAEVGRGLERIGWRGLFVLIAWASLPYCILGLAWFVLIPGSPWRDLGRLIRARVIRDSTGELLPLTALGGFAAGVRAAVLLGIDATTAAAATVVDLTTELIAQLGFTALGVALLAERLSHGLGRENIVEAALLGLALSALAAAGFVLFQRRGWSAFSVLAGRLWPALGRRLADVGRMLAGLYEPVWRLATSTAVHLTAWVASAFGVWLAIAAAGQKVDPIAIIGLEALVYAVRSVAFFTPMGAGVQEATYALIGPVFGLPADLAIAVSLIKRAKDLVIGVPALALWQAAEGRRLLRG
ncbi:MAG TPA: lysylphosphatidylglycerol synthase domain-containing protein [Caulobacteraceae bacterium]|nr:lysylphosphatidylglycerol synthase domain-containing protein [Caulobacteraceae bacterium]